MQDREGQRNAGEGGGGIHVALAIPTPVWSNLAGDRPPSRHAELRSTALHFLLC